MSELLIIAHKMNETLKDWLQLYLVILIEEFLGLRSISP